MKRSIISTIAATALIGLASLFAAAESLAAWPAPGAVIDISAVPDMDIASLPSIPAVCLAETPAWQEEHATVRRNEFGCPAAASTATVSTAKLQPEIWRWPKRA